MCQQIRKLSVKKYMNAGIHPTKGSIKLFIDDFDTNRCRKCSLKVQKVPAGIF